MGSAQELSHSVSSPSKEPAELSPHVEAARDAWREFCNGVDFQYFCLAEVEDGPQLPKPIAAVCALWRPLVWRFHPYSLKRLFWPLREERRDRLANLSQCVFLFGAEELDEDQWADADALLAEFGGDFPPRDWMAMNAAELVGLGMGYSREEVAAIVA